MTIDFGTAKEKKILRPPLLQPGERVGIIAPASNLAVRYPVRFEKSIVALAQSLSVSVVVANQVYGSIDTLSSRPKDCASALQTFFCDPLIKAVFCTIGGFSSAEILPFIDYDVIAENPTIIVGYSDPTALLLGLSAMTGLVTFHGPMLLNQFGEYPICQPFTVNSLRLAICTFQQTGVLIEDPDSWTNEFLDWGDDVWQTKAREMKQPAAREVWREGLGQGRLFGGNIETLNMLVGTPYFVISEKIIFFWEATEAEAFLPRIRRALIHLRQAGLFVWIQGMLIGRCPDAHDVDGVTLREMVEEVVEGYNFPILANIAFGHTDPVLTLPIGTMTKIVASQTETKIQLLEPSVVADSL